MSTSSPLSSTVLDEDNDSSDEFFVRLNEVDNVTKNIIREIIRECAIKQTHIGESFVTYFVKLASLDPKWGLSPERSMSRPEVAFFVEESMKKLCEWRSLSIICLKMQLYFNTMCTPRHETIQKCRDNYEAKLSPIENDLKFAQYPKDDEAAQSELYNKIVFYITLKAGLGNPLHLPVQKEAFLALHSIFLKSDVRYFTKLSLKDKKKNLEEMTSLVAGIRLFNRDCGTGGAGIDDVPKYLTEAIESILQSLSDKLAEIMANVYLLTTALEYVPFDGDSDIHTDSGKDEESRSESKSSNQSRTENKSFNKSRTEIKSSKVSLSIPEGESNIQIEYIKGCLIIYRQYEVYIRRLILEVQHVQKRSIHLIERLQRNLQNLHAIVKFRTAIPTSQVFPLFMKISNTWFQLFDEAIVLNSAKTINAQLQSLTKYVQIDHHVLNKLINGRKIITDAERISGDGIPRIPQKSALCKIFLTNQPDEYQKLPIQFLGFCPVQLVELNGALFPGNPNIGILIWEHMYFVFSSVENAVVFQKHPDIIYQKCLELARKNLELIFLLQLYDHLSSLRNIGKIFIKPTPVIIRYDTGVQTEVHPQEGVIVPNYRWNIWELKREAILFSNLKNSLTKACQTDKSNHRAPVAIQAYLPKDQATQSMKDVYTNVPTLQNFIFGLRGRRTDDQHVIELTRPVHE